MKLTSVRFSLKANVKVHSGRVNEGELKSTRKEIWLTSERLTVDKDMQIA